MIFEVRLEGATYKEPPTKFEAGTPHIAGAIGMGEAADFLMEIGMEKLRNHEMEMNRYAIEGLKKIKGLKIYGPLLSAERSGLVTFTMEKIHPHDLSQVLSEEGVAVRAGNHCAMPVHTRFGLTATVRASFGIYTTKEDIERLAEGIERAKKKLR